MIKIGAASAALGLLVACSSSKPTTFVTVTVPPSSRPHVSATPGAGSATATATLTPPASASTPPQLSKLPGTCDTLLPVDLIATAVGATSLDGTTAFVVGAPEADIGRVAYLNCRYGVTGAGAAAVPKIEIGLSLYSLAGKATARIAATVDDYTAHGATAAAELVDGHGATQLSGGTGAGYDGALLVIAWGQRTVAVSIDPSFAGGAAATKDAIALAALALKRSGG